MKDFCSTPRQLATRWVWYLEFGVLPESPHLTPQIRTILARELNVQNKNPEDWTNDEVQTFLNDLIGPLPIGDIFKVNVAALEPRRSHIL